MQDRPPVTVGDWRGAGHRVFEPGDRVVLGASTAGASVDRSAGVALRYAALDALALTPSRLWRRGGHGADPHREDFATTTATCGVMARNRGRRAERQRERDTAHGPPTLSAADRGGHAA
jgi:hypothetical protein